MLEYETANPGQDSTRPEGEHFNPDLDQSHPHVAFAPEEYAMEEGRSEPAYGNHQEEYGMARRPFSDSPAPPHKNDQFAGLAEGGMHAGELVKPAQTTHTSGSTSSDQALFPGTDQSKVPMKPVLKPGSQGNASTGKERSLRSNTQTNRNINSRIPRDEEFYDK